MYGQFVGSVEDGARRVYEEGFGGDDGLIWDDGNDGTSSSKRSIENGNNGRLKPWETGFHSTGGFLAPAFAGDAVATWSPQPRRVTPIGSMMYKFVNWNRHYLRR
jgi:hypothetical protein